MNELSEIINNLFRLAVAPKVEIIGDLEKFIKENDLWALKTYNALCDNHEGSKKL